MEPEQSKILAKKKTRVDFLNIYYFRPLLTVKHEDETFHKTVFKFLKHFTPVVHFQMEHLPT